MRVAWSILVLLVIPLIPAAPATSACAGPANDCIDAATEWFGKTEWFSNVGATMESGEPATCGTSSVQRSVWFVVEVLEPGTSDQLGIELDASWYATLGIYQKDAGGALVQKACQTSWEDEGLHSPTAFVPCVPGKYWVQVGSMGPTTGTFSLRDVSVRWRFDLTLTDPCPFAPTLPTEPRLSAPTGGNGQISLSWVEPWWDGGYGATITSYRVHRADTCAGPFVQIASTPHRGHTDTGLAPATTRCYKVTAVNQVGEGPAEPPRSGTTWNVPSAPTGLGATRAGKGELSLAWSPVPQGPAPLTGYRVYGASNSAGPFALLAAIGPSSPSYRETGLADGETRHYRVSAVNAVGEGAPSAPASGTTWAVPGAPRDVNVRAQLITTQPGSFEITWAAPSGNLPFTEYRVYRANSEGGAAQFIGAVASTRTSFVDGNRGAFLDYYYEVRASNPAGESAPSGRTCGVWPMDSTVRRCP